MRSLYRSASAQHSVQAWCSERLATWDIPHENHLLETREGQTHVVAAGSGGTAIVFLPGTNFNAATSLRFLTVLAASGRVFAVDLPGQPGLSTPEHPREDPHAQGAWLSEVFTWLGLETFERLLLVGHSRGAHVALCADPARVGGLALLSPAGLGRVRMSTAILRTALPWMLRPTRERSFALLRLMSGPAFEPDPAHVDWIAMVGKMCRTSGAPGPVPRWVTDRWRVKPITVVAGERDCVFPPARLAPAAQDRLGSALEVAPGVGHLSVEEAPELLARHALSVIATPG